MDMTIRGVNICRRKFIGGLGAGMALGLANRLSGAEPVAPLAGERYPGWRPGELDIH